MYFYLGNTDTISNLKNKVHYSLKSGPIFKDPKELLQNEYFYSRSFHKFNLFFIILLKLVIFIKESISFVSNPPIRTIIKK